jgi:aspartate/methionine/tyrosine aminotransferase
MNAPIQCALPEWLANRAEIQHQIQERVQANLAEVDRVLSKQKIVHRLTVEGGWYAVLRIPAYRPDVETALSLLSEGVCAHPGSFFGMRESGWFVVSLLGPVEEFSAGVTRMIDSLARQQ